MCRLRAAAVCVGALSPMKKACVWLRDTATARWGYFNWRPQRWRWSCSLIMWLSPLSTTLPMVSKVHPLKVSYQWTRFPECTFTVTGHVILSAGKDGVVAVSSLLDGAVTRVIEDHRGAPVTTIHCVNQQVSYQGSFLTLTDFPITIIGGLRYTHAFILRIKSSFSPLSKKNRHWCFCLFAGARPEVVDLISLKCSRKSARLNSPYDSRGILWHLSSRMNVLFSLNRQPFTAEGNEMWLAASADRRVSVWAADWLDDKCGLLDWLTFPAPACPEVRCVLTTWVIQSCPGATNWFKKKKKIHLLTFY